MEIKVFADWKELEGPTQMGTLDVSLLRGKEIFSFTYVKDWLRQQQYCPIDPNLGLYQGRQFPPSNKSNFGLFLDSCPDRWGRFLLQRREVLLAKKENRNTKRLYESDYLLGVHDKQRMGALRFQVDERFLDDNDDYSAPPWTSISKLAHVSYQLEDDSSVHHPEYEKWLTMLVQPGSSLGGARPKASIVDENKDLWIAKFPSRNDDMDVGLWEKLANILAKNAGLDVPESTTLQMNSKHHTFPKPCKLSCSS